MPEFIPGEYRIFDIEEEMQYGTERINTEEEFNKAVDKAVKRLIEDGLDMNSIELRVERVEVVPVDIKCIVKVTLL